MKKLSIVLASFLFVMGYISVAGAYGSKGGGYGFRGHGGSRGGGYGYRGHGGFKGHKHSRPLINRPPRQKTHLRHNRHHRHKSHKRHRQHYRHKGHHYKSHHRKYKDRHGYKRHYRYYSPYYNPYYRPFYGPYGRSYRYYDDGPTGEELPQAPRHSTSSKIYYSKNPEPWFLYGKGNELRQMGLIPPRQ